MRNSAALALGIIVFSATAFAGPFALVKVESIDKSSAYKVVTGEELKALQNQTDLEARLFRQAEADARKLWKEEGKKESFPGAEVGAPKITVVRDFTKREEAEEKLKDYEEREAKSEERKAEREKAQKKDKDVKAREQEKAALAKQAAGMIETRIKELADKQKAPEAAGDKGH